MTPVEIIKKVYGNIANISRDTGMDYQRLRKLRMKDDRIGTMTLNELWCLQRHAYFTDEEILEIARWKAREA